MNTTLISGLSVLAMLSGSPAIADATVMDEQQLTETARQKAMALGSELKSTLMAAVKKDGLAAGIEVCQQAAGPIADALSDEHWQVARTSLKLRSPDNQASAWAQQTLEDFAASLKTEPGTVPERSYMDKENHTFTYMKAIVTQPLCTNCHGNNIAPEVQGTLKRLYPDDQATGYNAGDLRGAFIVTYQAGQ